MESYFAQSNAIIFQRKQAGFFWFLVILKQNWFTMREWYVIVLYTVDLN